MRPRPGDPGARWPVGLTGAAAVGLGVAGERLLWAGPIGPGLAVWIGLLGAAAVAVVRRGGWRWSWATAGWSLVAVAAASGTAWRGAPALRLLFLGVLVVAASGVLLAARGRRLGRTRVLDHVHGVLLVPWHAAVGGPGLAGALEWPAAGRRRRIMALGRGALLAIPPVVVFGALFVAADPVFERVAERTVAGLGELPPHVFMAMVLAWIAAGLLRGTYPARRGNPLDRLRPRPLGIEETAVILSTVSALFIVFLAVQSTYLFGGITAAELGDLTLAEYARRGFFELVTVAGLVLGLLLVLGSAAPGGSGRWVFRALAGLLLVLVGAVVVSAALRLRLYIAEFGLTASRIYAAAAMGWIAVTLALYAATVLRGRPRPFASGALLAGIATVFALAAFNPDARVAETNLARSADRPVDVAYLLRLGPDAVPALVDGLPALDPRTRCQVLAELRDRWLTDEDADWRTWSAGEGRARRAVVESGGGGPGRGCG
jgi:hypothetical protein